MNQIAKTVIFLYLIGKESGFFLKILFKNKRLEKLCLSYRDADRSLGAICGKKLRTRLSEIDAASNVEELVAGRPHPLLGDRRGEFSLDLAGGFRLVFISGTAPIPEKGDGSINWAEVREVLVVYIGDYHD